jgi:hypothetical protein
MKLPRIPTGPEIKLPKLKLRKRSGEDAAEAPTEAQAETGGEAKPSRAASLPQPPAFVQDVYRDLRDRRLLLPALALALAIVAVPVLMKVDPQPAPSVAPAAVPEDAAAVSPAVLAEQELGVRDYRKRLAELKKKNPFEAKFQYTPKQIAEQTAIQEPPAPGADDRGGNDDGGAQPPSTGIPDTPGTPSFPPPADTTPQPEPEVETGLLVPEIDVRFGPVGDTKKIENVKLMKPLPGKNRAIVIFAGFGKTADTALFVISEDVVRTRGDGRCSPRAKNCKFLTLEEGEARFLDYRNRDGSTTKYRLKLSDLRTKVRKGPDVAR